MKKTSIFLFLILSPVLCRAMTLSDIRTKIRLYMRDTASTRYTDAQLNTAINDVQKEVNADVWAVETSTSYVLSPQTTYYYLPTDYIGATRATFTDKNGQAVQLQIYSEKNIIDGSPDYERSQIGAPSKFFTRTSKSGAASMQISYLPVPTSTSTGTVRVDYVCQPSDLSSDSDVPFNGLRWLYPYHEVIAYGVTAKLKTVEMKTDEANAYVQLFNSEEARMKAGIGGTPAFKPAAAVTK